MKFPMAKVEVRSSETIYFLNHYTCGLEVSRLFSSCGISLIRTELFGEVTFDRNMRYTVFAGCDVSSLVKRFAKLETTISSS